MEAVVICSNLKNILQSGSSLSGKVHSVFKNACNLVIDGDGDDDDEEIDVGVSINVNDNEFISVSACDEINSNSSNYNNNKGSGTSSSINIGVGGRFITLLNSNKVMSPMSMVVNTGSNFDFNDLNLKQNMKFEISNLGVSFKELDMQISINGAHRWNPECELTAGQLERKELEKNIRRLETGLFSKGKFSGMETLIQDLSCEIPELGLHIPVDVNSKKQKDDGLYGYNNYGFINNKFRTFIKVFIQGDVEEISESCKRIIGFGNGLTPSIDDFINGLMITNIYMGKGYGIVLKDLYAFNKGIVEASLPKTTRISSEMLKNGVYGLANDAVKQLLILLLAGKEHKEIDKAIEAAVDYGETSGTDTALGIYVGLKIWTNYDYRRVMLNDFICRN